MKPKQSSYQGIYNKLSGINFLETNYSLKFLFVAFLGIQIPSVGLVLLIFFDDVMREAAAPSVLGVLLLTVVSTVLTLHFLSRLLLPLKDANKALLDYLHYK